MYLKTLCERFMDGDETISDELIEMLMSIHKLLSSVYPVCEAKTPAFMPGMKRA